MSISARTTSANCLKSIRIGFNAWVNQQRMASAKELLCHSDWSIASIARNLGFSQTSYFCKVFRQTYQVTPQAFRQQINARITN
ncbi:helix-turn-helix transcriptional regulator [Klebsiella pneumoniae subsp. pneumoniae]|nr:helix-turn-helix transcriptional regulator [Klebsiella pneumoniae subsp. pneumoniae]